MPDPVPEDESVPWLENPVRARSVRTSVVGGIVVALILVGSALGYAYPLLALKPPLSYDAALGLLIAGVLIVVLFTAFTLRQDEPTLPVRVRVRTDGIEAEFTSPRVVQTQGRTATLPFGDSTLFLARAGFWGGARVVSLLRPQYRGEARVLALTQTNYDLARTAFSAWKASPHESDLSPFKPAPGVPLVSAPRGESAGISWLENSVASTGRHAARLREAAAVAAIFVGAYVAFAMVILTPVVGLLWAAYWAVAWYPFDLALVFPWLLVLLPLYPWWTRDVPQVGIDHVGLHLKRRNGKERVVPWEKVGGPTHQSFRPEWLLFFRLPNGTFSSKDFIVVDERVALAVAQARGCPHQKMANADAKALGLLTKAS